MITVTSTADVPLTFHASIVGFAVYLDNFAVIELAKGPPERRRRFVSCFGRGADLIFSLTNVAELCGPQGGSLVAIRSFLDEIGPHWFPGELDPYQVSSRELAGSDPEQSFVSMDFMKQYFASRTSGYTPASARIIDLSEEFFSLGAVLDWVTPQRVSILANMAALD